MGKQKKKRNKSYTGKDAAVVKPVITRISAANRSKIGQWWYENKKVLTPVIRFLSVGIFVILLIIEIVRIAAGAN
jgi:hypothetical protein